MFQVDIYIFSLFNDTKNGNFNLTVPIYMRYYTIIARRKTWYAWLPDGRRSYPEHP